MIPRSAGDELISREGIDQETAGMITATVNMLEEMGIPLLDHLSGLRLKVAADRIGQAKQALKSLKPGLTHFIIHPSKDTPELRRITDSWDCRVADYETFISNEMRDFIQNEGIQVIGYQALKGLMPASM
jgi:hypothetical protein